MGISKKRIPDQGGYKRPGAGGAAYSVRGTTRRLVGLENNEEEMRSEREGRLAQSCRVL